MYRIGGSRWERECFGEMDPDLLAEVVNQFGTGGGLGRFWQEVSRSVLLLLLHRVWVNFGRGKRFGDR